jgi:TolB-like protein/DNA-binding winged helix-turn-helix (wHTH) protein
MALRAPNLRFGTFELCSRTKELFRAGIRLRLRPQPFQVLQILLENAGEVVRRDELHKRLWPSDTFVDFEHGLNAAVKDLRAVLGDSAQEPRYLETLPRVGYRFIAPVKSGEEPARMPAPPSLSSSPVLHAPQEVLTEAAVPSLNAGAVIPESSPAAVRAPRRWIIASTLAAAVVVFAVVGYRAKRLRSGSPFPQGRILTAVLPFENRTGDPAQELLSETLTDEIISRLGRVDPLHIGVIARTSVMKYKNGNQTIESVARELGVQYLLQGSFQQEGDRITIATKLIRVRDRRQLWAHEYNRSAASLLEIQDEIAEETSDAVSLALGEQKHAEPVHAAPAKSANQSDAYLHYLKGRYFWNQRSEQGFEFAIREFQSAIDKQPDYAQAYAGLADSYNLSSSYGLLTPKDYMPKARAAALRALALDDTLAEAHTSLASVAQNFDWDWITAEKEYRRAIELNPNYATAHHWYGECLALEGRFDEAFVEIAKARELDPLSLIIAADYGAILYFSRQYGPAIQQFRAVLEMDPNFPRAHMIAYAFVEEGRFPEALEAAENWRAGGHAAWGWPMTVYVYGRWGKQGEAKQAFRQMAHLKAKYKMDTSAFVLLHIGLGDTGPALDWLEKACAEHSPTITAIGVDPIYDPLRNEPRFHAVLKQINLEK